MNKELKARLIPVFNANPNTDAFYVTDDGQAFKSNHQACLQQRDVLDVRILNDTQLPKIVTRNEVFEGKTGLTVTKGGNSGANVSAAAKKILDDAGIEYNTVTGTGKDGLITKPDAEKAILAKNAGKPPVLNITDEAKALFEEAGLEAEAGTGSGENGLITKEDAEKLIAAAQSQAQDQ